MNTRIPPEPHDRQCRIEHSVGQGSPVGRRRFAPLGLAWSEHDATLPVVGGAIALSPVRPGGSLSRCPEKKIITAETEDPGRDNSGSE